MTNKLRSTTNLVVPADLRLPRAEMKRRFMYIYSGAYVGQEPVFMNKLWLSYFFPEIVKDPSFGKNRKGVRSFYQSFEKYQKAGLLKLKKINDPADPHFAVAVPLAQFSRTGLDGYLSQLKGWFTDGKTAPDNHANQDALNDELKQAGEGVQQRQVHADEVIKHLGLDANSILALKECLFGLRLQFSGGLAVVYADFKITKEEAQQLTTTEWPMIRNMDMYPLLLHWQMSGWGYSGKAPTSSFPMSTISKTLPPVQEGQARVNEYGLSIAPDGACLWLPEKLDNTRRYEDRYSQAGDRGDDSFALIDMHAAGVAAQEGGDLLPKLPANIPVLIDWVNNRYAYTLSSGVLKVQDLTRFKVCDAAHAANLLKHWILDEKQALMFMEMGKSAGVADALYFTEEEVKEIQANDPVVASRLAVSGGVPVGEYWSMATNYWFNTLEMKEFVVADVSIEGDSIWRPFARFVETVQAAVIQNMDAVNQRFSVSGVASRLGMMTLIAKYGNDLTTTIAKSNALRAAATNQSVDPSWRPAALPLLMDNPERPFSLLPHQLKVCNLMKDSPDFAILPVQAGGGKCMAGDTLVTTDRGIMTLEEVFHEYKGDSAASKGFYWTNQDLKVLSTKGSYEKVAQLFRRKGTIWKVEMADGTIHEGLKEHKFYTQHGWKRIEELSASDYIVAQEDPHWPQEAYVFDHHIDYVEDAEAAYSVSRWKEKASSLEDTKIPTQMTSELAFVLGALVAEGYKATFYNTDEDFAAAYKEAFAAVFGVAPALKVGVRDDKPGNQALAKLKAPNLAIKNFLLDILGEDTLSSDRHIPTCVLQSEREHQVSFLKAFYEGDGEIAGIEGGARKGRVVAYTTSKVLQKQIHQVLKNLGIYGNLGSEARKRKTWVSEYTLDTQTSYHVSLGNAYAPKFEALVGFVSARKREHLAKFTASDRESSNGQNSNDTSQGWFNQVPALEEVTEFIEVLENEMDASDFREPNGRSEHPILFKQCLTYEVTGSKNAWPVVKGGSTRYSLNMLERVVTEDVRIQKAVEGSKHLTSLWKRILKLKSKVWGRVVKITPDVRQDVVYDFVLPRTRAWIANGYLSHNTPLAILDILKELKAGRNHPYLVMCPSPLVPQYVNEITYFTSGQVNCIPIMTDVFLRNGFERLQKMIESAPRNTIVIVNYDVLRNKAYDVCYGTTNVTIYPFIEFLRQFNFGYAMMDESHCFPAGTLVDTPEGKIAIEDIKVGDQVLGAVGPSKVTATSKSLMNTDLIELTYNGSKIRCTTKHPFLTTRGWVHAQDLVVGDTLVSQEYAKEIVDVHTSRYTLPAVQAKVSAASASKESAFLWGILFSEMENESARNKGQSAQQGSLREVFANEKKDVCGSSVVGALQEKDVRANEGKQPYVQPQTSEINDSGVREQHVFSEGRERDGSERVRADRDGHIPESATSIRGSDQNKEGSRVSDKLQDRSSLARPDGCPGNSRHVAQDEKSSRSGREEKGSARVFRLEGVTRIQLSDIEQAEGGQSVYNLQIEGHPSFSVNDALVHNSLKNDSQRTRAALQLIADIPKKRLASGTMAHDSPSDLALQVAMLDPTLFGSRDSFNKRFGEEVKGGRVTKWRPGAQQQIMAMIKSRIVVAKAMRKEWAALLPEADENMHLVTLSDAQYSVYQAILTEAFDKMKEDAKGNPALKKFFENTPLALENPQRKGDQGADQEADEEAEDDADESAGEDLEALLGFYLSRLEQFLTAPGKDELGARLLTGDDLRSPKVNKILEIIKNHIDSGIEGKVLVFTNYIDSAEEIFEAADPALRAQGILYTAAEKVEAGAQFEASANKKWMVGVENSMNTGLNFQHVSRLIRVENVWNPGTMEQGNSRVNRPQLKKADRRNRIYFDWIAADRTYDVTKISRLISKIIAVAKFENTENPAYEDLPDVPVIPMSAEAIIARNSREDLIEYAQAYKSYNTVKAADYAEYREQHGGLTMTPLRIAPRPNDAAIMAQVPYVPGTELFKGSEHGLIRVDEYLRVNDIGGDADEEETDDPEMKEMTPKQRQHAAIAKALIGMLVHTEFGDGIVKTVSLRSKRVNFALPSGYLTRVKFSAAYVIKPNALKEATMREQLMKGISEDMPVIAPVDVLGRNFRIDKAGARQAEKERKQLEKEATKVKKAEKVVNALNVELGFAISNGFLSIVYYPEEGSNAGAALQALGFRPEEPYVFAEVTNAKHLVQQFKKWKEAGFSFDPKFEKASNASDAIRDLHVVLQKGTLHTGVMNYRFANRNQLQNFFRMELKPSANNREFKVYPMIEDGGAYLVMHTRGQPATKAAMQIRSPGIRWQQAAERIAYYALTPEKTAAKMTEILDSGIQIMNLKELQVEFRKLKKQGFRNAEVPEQH